MSVIEAYAWLGVNPSATDDEIHRAWRALMLRWHPDRHPGNAHAAAVAAKINEAYQAVKLARVRMGSTTCYDTTWSPHPPPPPPPPPPPRPPPPPPPRPPPSTEDVQRNIKLPWETAFRGGTVSLDTDHGTVTITVPPGCPIGKTWRRKGKGKGSPPGDLIIKVAGYEGDVPWRIKGKDVYAKIRITFYQIYVRESVMVQSPWGKVHELSRDFTDTAPTRIKGEGVAANGKRGDFIIEWEVVYPPRGSLELASLLRYLQELRR